MELVSTQIDDWLEDRCLRETVWVTELSNGEVVYQDDYRPDMYPISAWERLGIYCKNQDTYIVNMSVRFRSHIKQIGSGKDGYFFSRGVQGGFGGSSEFYLTGTLHEGILSVVKWQIPTLIRTPFIDDSMEQIRNPEESGLCLIRKNNG